MRRLCTTSLFLFLVLLHFATDIHAADRPNFVWLVSEDNSKHFIRLFDPTGSPMPHVEALAEQGLIFEHAFSNAPVCSVARTTLATSCYAPRIGTQYHRRAQMADLPEGVHMTPTILRQNGYYTANNSKTDYNASDKDVWNDSSRSASWRKRAQGQPFFYMQSFATTHESSLHFTQQQMESQPTKTDPASVFIQPIHPDTQIFRYTYARYHDQHQKLDQQIGEVIEQLKSDGLIDDTFIFYFGDHGGVLPGSKGYLYERGLHVPLVVYIPKNFRHLLGNGFDAKNPLRVNGFVEFVDFGPTLLSLAGIDTPQGIDGKPFLGQTISLDAVNKRDEAFGYADRFDEKYDMVRSLRKGDYKYIRNYQPFNIDGLYNQYRYKNLAFEEWRELFHAGKLNATQSQFFQPRPPEQLFNLKEDPYETNNLATDPNHAQVLKDLRARLRVREKAMPDLSFIPEPAMLEMSTPDFTAFGQSSREMLAACVDLADLQLLPYAEAAPGIRKAIDGKPHERYWGLIVASAFGKQALEFTERAMKIATTDDHMLIRARAIELLGLTGADTDVSQLINDTLARCESPMDTLLVLNTAALLKDTQPGFDFQPKVKPEHARNSWVTDRLNYFKK